MSYAVDYRASATRELKDVPRSVQANIRRRVEQLAGNPRPPWARPLAGVPFWRFRVGKYRVVYEILDAERRVIIARVGPRADVYRGLE